jgi:hypothetical protein
VRPARLVAVVVRAPGLHAVNPAPIASAAVASAAAAAAAAAAADPNSDAACPAAVAVAASAPVPVATSAAPTASTAAAVAVASAASAAVAAMAAVADKLYAGPGRADVFFVENIERCQGNVGNFLLTESDFVTISRVSRRHIRCEATGYGACAAH